MASSNDVLTEEIFGNYNQFPIVHESGVPTSNADKIQDIQLSCQMSAVHEVPILSNDGIHHESETTATQTTIVNTPSDDEEQTSDKFLIQVGTVPGSMAGKLCFRQSQLLQKQLLDGILRRYHNAYRVNLLDKFNITHTVVLRDGFSDTERWGLEPNFYIIVKGTQELAFGVAALLGAVFGQDAVGICSHLPESDLDVWKSSYGQKLPDGVHRLISVRPQNKTGLMTSDIGEDIMKHIREEFSGLPGQLDIFGRSIEFHEYGTPHEKFSDVTIKQILEKKLDQSYRAKELLAKSHLLEAKDYEIALNKSGLIVTDLIGCIKLAREHASLFCCNKNVSFFSKEVT